MLIKLDETQRRSACSYSEKTDVFVFLHAFQFLDGTYYLVLYSVFLILNCFCCFKSITHGLFKAYVILLDSPNHAFVLHIQFDSVK